jgi:hypothetical protein
MKITLFIALFVLFCSTQAYVVDLAEYQSSLATWNRIKPKTYTFVQYIEPSLVDVEVTTTITVTDGVVVRRAYYYNDYSGDVITWVEDTPEEIGTHQQGFDALTLDQIYSECLENVLVYDEVLYIVKFLTDSNGLLKECSYYPSNASDGALGGITISSIELEK